MLSLHPCMKLMRILKKAITDTPHISIDMEQTQHSKTFNKIPATDIVISIGCDVGCLYSGISFDNNRKLQDPTGQSDAVLIEVIKQIEEHMSICKVQRLHTARRSFLLSADIWSCQKELQPKKISSKGLYPPSERKRQKQTLLAAYYNLCNSPLHKHLPKSKKTTTAKKRYSIFLTASEGALIPAFDGTVMAISKGIAPTNLIGSTIL